MPPEGLMASLGSTLWPAGWHLLLSHDSTADASRNSAENVVFDNLIEAMTIAPGFQSRLLARAR